MLLSDDFLKNHLHNNRCFYSGGFLGKEVNKFDKENYFLTL